MALGGRGADGCTGSREAHGNKGAGGDGVVAVARGARRRGHGSCYDELVVARGRRRRGGAVAAQARARSRRRTGLG